jgi:hypothetical protein
MGMLMRVHHLAGGGPMNRLLETVQCQIQEEAVTASTGTMVLSSKLFSSR